MQKEQPVTSLKWKQVNAWRLAQHFLSERAESHKMLDVVTRLGGVQAQVMSAAELALWARVQNVSPSDVQQSLWHRRTLVKTWAMRGTLHLLAAEDFALYIAAFSTLSHYRRPSWLKYFGVTAEELEALIKGVRATLHDSGLTRERLAEAIARRLRRPELREMLLSGWGSLLKPAAFQGHLCFGPNEGQNVTFVRPEKWLGAWPQVESESALKEVARRYLNAYGPATADEFARWFGLQLPEAKRIFRGLGDEIAPVSVEGWQAWSLTAAIEQMQSAGALRIVRLLPYFDPYTIAVGRHIHYLLPGDHKARIYRTAGWISPVVIADGRIEGVWEYNKQRSHIVARIELFTAPGATLKRGIAAEAKRLGEFLNTEVRVNYVTT
ncbi:MAG: winged helix DNA-binding domain-containing protein [Blastocatellia bacterium]